MEKNFKNTLKVSALSLCLIVGTVGMVSAATSNSTNYTADPQATHSVVAPAANPTVTTTVTPAVHKADTPVAHSVATPATPATHATPATPATPATHATTATTATHTTPTTPATPTIQHATTPIVTHNETQHSGNETGDHMSDGGSGHHE